MEKYICFECKKKYENDKDCDCNGYNCNEAQVIRNLEKKLTCECACHSMCDACFETMFK